MTLDCELSLSGHVGRVSRSCFYQLRQLRQIRRTLNDNAARMLVNAFVISRIDYCNAIHLGTTSTQIGRIQRILNSSARLLLRLPKFAHISLATRNTLHWLPVSQRVRFKTILLVWNSLSGKAPSYLRDLCIPLSSIQGRRQLRSSNQTLLHVPRCRTTTLQKRGFAVAGPSTWNALPSGLRSMVGTSTDADFKRCLKTHLF